jgi:quinol monooxygenase YgiN
MIVLIVKLHVKPGTEEECKTYMRAMETETRKEPGCVLYFAHQSTEDPTVLAFYEQYKDKAAFDTHCAAPYFEKFVKNGINKIVVGRDRTICGLIS